MITFLGSTEYDPGWEMLLVEHDILDQCRFPRVTLTYEDTHTIICHGRGVEFLQLKIHSTVVSRFIS